MKTQKLILAAATLLQLIATTALASGPLSNGGSKNTTSIAEANKGAKISRIDMIARTNADSANEIINSYLKGTEDADSLYKAKKSGKKLVFFTTIIGTPILGAITAALCANIPPKQKNLSMTDKEWIHNPNYIKGYRDEARFLKKRKIWGSYIAAGISWGCAVQLLVL